MFKNKKGFTLVELLAAIVILGILSVFAIPMITGMVENSRNKMYVDDALKLIARAEYQMKASSNTIDKPDAGDCIIISMAYLQANEIVTAPNGGEYDKDQSYVVIKNSGNGKLEYAATIIEDLSGGKENSKKNGYKGIKLTPYKSLLAANATSHVVPIADDELVDDIENIKTAYLKNELGDGYITGRLVAIYHYHEVKDASIQTVTSSDPYFVGDIESNRNDLVARITFKVNDEDTARSDLKVYYSAVEKNYTTANPYGNNPVYTIVIDFSKEPYKYEHDQARDIPIYIKVEDPEGNSIEKVHHYFIRSNIPPTIADTETFVTKRQDDMIPLLDASVTLVVEDDLDDPEDLLICARDGMSEDGVDSCFNYQKYAGGKTKKFDYHFYCGGSCTRDGETHFLTIFVKDSYGAESKITKPYTFSKNTAPYFDGAIEVSSDTETYPSEGNKKIHVRFKVGDDYSNLNQIKVFISEDQNNWREYRYSDDTNSNDFDYDLSGRYDGLPRTIYIKLQDHEGLYSTVESKNYTVYKNDGPEISYFAVTSNGQACDKGNLCALQDGGKKNGSLDALIELGVTDYLEAENNYANIRVCVSEVRANCDNDANFKSYSEYYGQQVSYPFEGTYDGSTRKMYAVIKDNDGHSDEADATYQLYKDSKPQITDFDLTPVSEIASEGETGYSTSAYLNIAAIDDFTDDEHLLFTLKKNGEVILRDVPLSDLYEKTPTGEVGENGQPLYQIIYNYELPVSDSYDGVTYHFEVTVKDNQGAVSDAKAFDYKVFLNSCPQIDGSPRVQFASNNYGVNSNFLDLYFYPRFRDDVDTQLQVIYCYKIGTADPVCTSPVYTDVVYHLTKDNLFADLDYAGQTVKVYAVALDSLDPECAVKTDEYSFRIHNKVGKPEILYSAATYVPGSHETPTEPVDPDNPDEPVVDTGPHEVTAYFQIRDLFDTYQVCMSKENNGAQCTNFVGPDGTSATTFDGTDLLMHSLTYSYEGEITDSTNLYLFTKGMADTATTNYAKATIPITAAGTCSVKDATHPYYEYTYAGNGSKINITDCNHKCYHYNFLTNETVSFSRNYNIKIKYRDANNLNGSFCSSFEESRTAVPMYCDFKDCFYDSANNNYEQDAVGIIPFDDSVPWTEEINDLIYINYSHYNLYRSSYTEGKQNITLTRQATVLSPYCIDNNLYNFNYVRVADN